MSKIHVYVSCYLVNGDAYIYNTFKLKHFLSEESLHIWKVSFSLQPHGSLSVFMDDLAGSFGTGCIALKLPTRYSSLRYCLMGTRARFIYAVVQ